MSKNKKIKVAINGFGRIGRAFFKIALLNKNIEIVAINDLADIKTLEHLLKYDTVYGKYEFDSKSFGKVFSEKDPSLLPWKKLGIDVVVESTGFFTSYEKAGLHLKAGAKKVIISAPAKDDSIKTCVIGVNDECCAKEKIISNASCTTNCIAPIMAIIEKEFGIKKAMMTTVHSYTADQNLVDGPHKDLRRARAAGANIVPTTTGAAIAAGKTIPALEGKFDGIALRVPTICGSLSDITIVTSKEVNVKEVNKVFINASKNVKYKGIVGVTEEQIVSSDIIKNTNSCVVDLSFTQVVGGDLLKILAWYDNEWGYASRLVEMVAKL